MAKTLKQFLEAVKPFKNENLRPEDQVKTAKLTVDEKPDRNEVKGKANGDDVFKGNTKAYNRKPFYGYNPGEDAKVHEEAEEVNEKLIGKQKKLDKNHNGKLDAQDFKMLRKEDADYLETDLKKRKVNNDKAIKDMKKMGSPMRNPHFGEEVEQIDELSTDTLKSYRTKARAQGNKIIDNMKVGGGDWSKDQVNTKTLRKRSKGANMSGKILVRRGESLKTEEVEQIEEAGYSAKAARAGKDIGKPGKQFANIARKAAKKYGSEESGKNVAGAILAKLRKEDVLADRLSDISESNRNLMTTVFEQLSEENQQKFLESCKTPEGIDLMLDFSIMNRGK